MRGLRKLLFLLTVFLLPTLAFAEFTTTINDDWNKINLNNNTIDNSVNKDVGCTKIEAPTGIIDSGQSVIPACSVYNYGTKKVNYEVRMKIGDFYNQTAMVSKHSPDQYLYVTFPEVSFFQRGTHIVTCSTELGGDRNKENDMKIGSVFVRVLMMIDVGCTKIVSPPEQVNLGEMIIPACSVYNFGNVFVDYYSVHIEISGYVDDKIVENHFPGTYQYVEFEPWWPVEVGSLPVIARTELAGDMNPSNNEKKEWVLIIEPEGLGSIKHDKVNFSSGVAGSTVWIKTKNKGAAILKVYNVMGKLIHSAKTDKGSFTISGLPTGTYILRLETKDQTEIKKLLVVR